MVDDPLPPAVRTLLGVVSRLARSTTSGRLALAHAHAVVDPAAMPEGLRERVMVALDGAAQTVVPLDPMVVRRVLREAGTAVDGLAVDGPLAVTPGAQLHQASVDGDTVVVKLLRPGIREAVRSDLGLLETLTGPVGAAFPAVDAGTVIGEIRERILDELDLEHEAATQRTAARALRRHTSITVPSPLTELCRENVLVSAHAAGPTLAAGVPAGSDAGTIAQLVVRAFVGLPRTAGVLHADAEPGNVIVTGPASIAIVDFGAACRVDLSRIDQGLAALSALRADDGDAFADALLALGVLPDAATCTQTLTLLKEVGGALLTGPARWDAPALLAFGARVRERRRDILALALQAQLEPQDLWPLRMLVTLAATLARLEATEDWVALVLAAGYEGC